MRRTEVAVLACRILGLYVILRSFDYLPVFFRWIMDPEFGHYSSAADAMSFVIMVLSGILLLGSGGYIGAKLAKLRVERETSPEDAASESQVGWTAALAFCLLGLMDLLTSIPALVDGISKLNLPEEDRYGSAYQWLGDSTAAIALRVALGLWLVLGAKGWARALRYLRRVGLQPHERAWEEKGADRGPDQP